MLGRLAFRRLVGLVVVMLGVTFLGFLVLNILPGSAADAILGANATGVAIKQLSQQLGLNQPVLDRYGQWLWHALHGNLGTSFVSGSSVSSSILARVPVTLELVIGGMALALLLAVPLALAAGWRAGGAADRAIAVLSAGALSIPNFVLALLLVLGLSVSLQLFPAEGFVPLGQGVASNFRTMTLPWLALGLPFFGIYCRLLRGEVADQLKNQEYVLAARALGLPEWKVMLRYVLRNALPGLVTVTAANFGTLVGTTVIIESIFALPGIGQLMLNSVVNKDEPMVQGLIVLLAIVVVVANLLADLAHRALDPRVANGIA